MFTLKLKNSSAKTVLYKSFAVFIRWVFSLFICVLACFVLFCLVFFFRETQLKSRGRLKNSLHLLNQKIVLVFIYIMILHKSLVLWCVQVKNPCKLKKKYRYLTIV